MLFRSRTLFLALLVSSLAGSGFISAQTTSSIAAGENGTALDPVLQDERLWEMSREVFMERFKPLHFEWVSQAQQTAAARRGQPTLLGEPVDGMRVEFGETHPAEVDVVFFNRGDSGDLSEKRFGELLQKTKKILTGFAGVEPEVLGKDTASAVLAYGLKWKVNGVEYLLEYSFTREVKTRGIPFRAEFIRLQVKPVAPPKGLLEASLEKHDARSQERFVGRDHVKKQPNGDVVITDVPMVDQGEKGYCVVATAERCLRYFGVDASQHELAQVSNASASEGTSVMAMMESLKKLTQRLRIRVRTLEEFDTRSFLRMLDDYNRATRRGKEAPELNYGQVLDMTALYSQMKPELLKEVRTKNLSSMNGFMRDVQKHIDEGIPLLWSVMLGIVPEKEIPQAFGGHMRLIIGYNEKTSQILYSDSWGAGHELKRMALADAWTVTTGLNTVEPL